MIPRTICCLKEARLRRIRQDVSPYMRYLNSATSKLKGILVGFCDWEDGEGELLINRHKISVIINSLYSTALVIINNTAIYLKC